MAGSRYQPSVVDGLPARLSGAWAREKLKYLDKYMHLFSVGMKNRWNRVYLDLLAGPGRCVEKDTNEEFDGSPLRALACHEPFTRVMLVEGDPKLASALRTRVAGRAEVLDRDCNEPGVIARLRDAVPSRGTLGLAFIDNLGLDVPLATIQQLTDERKIDLFIVFQTQDLKRNLSDVLDGTDAEERWTAFFGTGWQDVALRARQRNASADDTATELLHFYASQLERLGYPHISHSRRLMKNSRDVGLYRLILAGKHERAVDFFEKVSEIDPWDQRSFF